MTATTTEPEADSSRRPRRPRRVHGPVYAAVTAQIRAQFGTSTNRTPDQALAYAKVAGYVGSCRSLASSIDRATGDDPCPNQDLPGHDCKRHQVSGRDVAQLHDQLAKMLERLAPAETQAPVQALHVLMQHLTPGAPPTTPPLPGVGP